MRRMLARLGVMLLPVLVMLAAGADAVGWASTWTLLAVVSGTWSVMTLWGDRFAAVFEAA